VLPIPDVCGSPIPSTTWSPRLRLILRKSHPAALAALRGNARPVILTLKRVAAW
jgi:hypothetical protein